jgi:hypothetical protein
MFCTRSKSSKATDPNNNEAAAEAELSDELPAQAHVPKFKVKLRVLNVFRTLFNDPCYQAQNKAVLFTDFQCAMTKISFPAESLGRSVQVLSLYWCKASIKFSVYTGYTQAISMHITWHGILGIE